jgi:hypothetical protein
MADDPKISERYRALAREEPPRALDDAILAASRRAVEARPAPLVGPGGKRRWYFPLAAAAVIVLAVAVTMHVEREQPMEEIASAPPAAAPAEPPSTREFMREERQAAQPAPAPQPERRRQATAPEAPAQDQLAKQSTPSASDSVALSAPPAEPATPAPPPPLAGARGELERKDEARAMQAPAPQAAAKPRINAVIVQSPEQWLQSIAELRRQGLHEAADRSLAEFRRQYPDYKIPEAMRQQVEKK